MFWDLKKGKEGLFEERSNSIFENGKGDEDLVSILYIDIFMCLGIFRKCFIILL